MIDITKTTEPKSDQQNFDDYVGGPKTVTVAECKVFDRPEQPVAIGCGIKLALKVQSWLLARR